MTHVIAAKSELEIFMESLFFGLRLGQGATSDSSLEVEQRYSNSLKPRFRASHRLPVNDPISVQIGVGEGWATIRPRRLSTQLERDSFDGFAQCERPESIP